MNLFQSIVCNQYADLKKNGRDISKTRLNSVVLFSAAIFLVFGAIFILWLMVSSETSEFRTTYAGIGKGVGKLIAALLVFIFFLITYNTIGSKTNIDKTIAEYERLSQADQKQVCRTGMMMVFISMGVFFSVFILMMVLGK